VDQIEKQKKYIQKEYVDSGKYDDFEITEVIDYAIVSKEQIEKGKLGVDSHKNSIIMFRVALGTQTIEKVIKYNNKDKDGCELTVRAWKGVDCELYRQL